MSFMDYIPTGSPRPLRSQARPNYRNPDAFRIDHNLTPPSEWQGDEMDAAPEADLAADMQSKIKRPKAKWNNAAQLRQVRSNSGAKSVARRMKDAEDRLDQIAATPGDMTYRDIMSRFDLADCTARGDLRRLFDAGRLARRKEGPANRRYFVYWSLEAEEEEEVEAIKKSLHNADRRRAMADFVMRCSLPMLRALECLAGFYSRNGR